MKILAALLTVVLCFYSLSAHAGVYDFVTGNTNQVADSIVLSTAEHSMLYKGVVSISQQAFVFSKGVQNKIFVEIVPLISTLITIYILIMGIRFYMKKGDIYAFSLEFLFIGAFITAVLSTPMFDLIFQYILELTTYTSSLVMEYSLNLAGIEKPNTGTTLGDTFKATENLFHQAVQINNAYEEQYKGFWNFSFVLGGLVMIMFLVYFIIMLLFFLMYTSIYISMILLFIFAKPLAMLAIIPAFRPLIKNLGKSILTFSLALIFVAIANALTLFATVGPIGTLVESIEKDSFTLPYTTLVELIILGVFGGYFHLKASTYAAMITGSNVTDFGQTFSALVAGGLGAAKAHSMKAGGAAIMNSPRGVKAVGSGVMETGKGVAKVYSRLIK